MTSTRLWCPGVGWGAQYPGLNKPGLSHSYLRIFGIRASEEIRGEKLIFSVSPSQFAVNVKTDSKESASDHFIDRSVQHLDMRPF